MIHVDTPGIMRETVSKEMFDRIVAVKTFLMHAKRRPTNEMVAAYGVASLGDFVSAKSCGHVFYSLRGGVLTPFSFAGIRNDMRTPAVTNYDLAKPSPEIMNTIKEIRKKIKLKNGEIVLLGIGFLSDLIERFVAGEIVLIGPSNVTSLESMVEYESDVIKDYRPVLIN